MKGGADLLGREGGADQAREDARARREPSGEERGDFVYRWLRELH